MKSLSLGTIIYTPLPIRHYLSKSTSIMHRPSWTLLIVHARSPDAWKQGHNVSLMINNKQKSISRPCHNPTLSYRYRSTGTRGVSIKRQSKVLIIRKQCVTWGSRLNRSVYSRVVVSISRSALIGNFGHGHPWPGGRRRRLHLVKGDIALIHPRWR